MARMDTTVRPTSGRHRPAYHSQGPSLITGGPQPGFSRSTPSRRSDKLAATPRLRAKLVPKVNRRSSGSARSRTTSSRNRAVQRDSVAEAHRLPLWRESGLLVHKVPVARRVRLGLPRYCGASPIHQAEADVEVATAQPAHWPSQRPAAADRASSSGAPTPSGIQASAFKG